MAIICDKSYQLMTDEATGVSLRAFSRPDYEIVYRYFDPAITVIAKTHARRGVELPVGSVDLDAVPIYDRAPSSTPEGKALWGQMIGEHVSCHRLYDLYRTQLRVEGNPPEVQALAHKAETFVQEAIKVRWKANGSRNIPLVDIDSSQSLFVTCRIARYGISPVI